MEAANKPRIDNTGCAAAEIIHRFVRAGDLRWPALREKVVCQDAGLDDVELELTKMAILRNVAGSPIGYQIVIFAC